MAKIGGPVLIPIVMPVLMTAVLGWTMAAGQTAISVTPSEAGEIDRERPVERKEARYDSRVRRLDSHAETDEALRARLERRLTVGFAGTPLSAVIAEVADATGIHFRIDGKAIQEHGVTMEEKVTVSITDVPTDALLRLILRPMNLTAIVRDGHVVVTTREAAADDPATWFYPLPTGFERDPATVMEMVQTIVKPDGWDVVGGPASMTSISGIDRAGFVIHAPDEMHERILPLLAGLDTAGWSDEVDGAGPAPRHIRVHAVPNAEVRDALVDSLVAMCNESLAHGADPEADVTEIGRTIVVRSKSPEFHLRVAELIAAILESNATAPSPGR